MNRKETDDLFEHGFENTLQREKFSTVAPIYSFTTENIGGYFPHIDFNGKSVLTVGGSGDHAINAYLAGAKEVTCFDVNSLANYYSGLKVAALKQFDYEEFLGFLMRGSPNILSYDSFAKLSGDLPIDSRYFFEKLYEKYHGNGQLIRESALFNNKYDSRTQKINNNSYLLNEANYAKSRQLVPGGLKWFQNSLQELAIGQPPDNHRFDLILLSNIADYSHLMFPGDDYLERFGNEVIATLLNEYLTENGILVAAYIYQADSQKSFYRNLIDDPDTRKKAFRLENCHYEEIRFPSVISGEDAVVCLSK